ncbi:hypothetical protein GCM10022280_18210 [Sphingomonas swuensis]|uniref:Bacterial sugar transferase domain-containing protein n=1 Tax=Sphingomonas swuensis TaxID=977800 RepID=A0ABP7SZN7_9SPHN
MATRIDDSRLAERDQELVAPLRAEEERPRLFSLVRDEPLVVQHEPLFVPSAGTGARLCQRCLDVTVALVALLLVWPLLLLGAVLVLASGPGPIFYSHRRLGRDGQVFGCIKLRTMRTDADRILQELLRSSPAMMAEWVADRKLRNDPRITRIGQFLRRYSLDELPQLFNVLRGEMSIVGPRPLATDEAQHYGADYRLCFSVNPGITGLWQVSGRNDVSYQRRVELDCHYATVRCLALDLSIMLRTIPVVLGGTGH